jgi:hypothetical protein
VPRGRRETDFTTSIAPGIPIDCGNDTFRVTQCISGSACRTAGVLRLWGCPCLARGIGEKASGDGRPAIRRVDADLEQRDLTARGATAAGDGRRGWRAARRLGAVRDDAGAPLQLRRLWLLDRDPARLRARPGLLRQQSRHAGRRGSLHSARAVRRGVYGARKRLPGVLQLGRRLRRLLHRVLREPRLVRRAAEPQRDLHERHAEPMFVWAGVLSVRARPGRRRRLLRVHLLTGAFSQTP